MEKEYLVYDYTTIEETGKVELSVVNDKKLIKLLSTAIETKLKIAVYEVGECLLDWS